MSKACLIWNKIQDAEEALSQAKTYALKEALRERIISLSAEWRRSAK